MKPTIWIVITCLIAAAASWVGYTYGTSAPTEDSSEYLTTETVQTTSIRGQGKLQPALGTIRIAAQPGERVDEILVEVGAIVKVNTPLVSLASRDARALELKLAKLKKEDALRQAKLQIRTGELKLRIAEIATQESKATKFNIENESISLGPLETNLETAKRSLEKLYSMQADPVTSSLIGQSEIDQQVALVESLKAQIQSAQGKVELGYEAAKRAYQLAETQENLAELAVDSVTQQVPVASLDLAIELAQMGYDATLLKSPVAGKVLDIAIHQGDTVGTRPLMLIGDTSKMICVAEITDSQLRDVSMGAKVEITSDAFDDTLNGTVIEIGTMIGPPSMSDPNPFAQVDRTTGKVKIALSDEDTPIASQFVNLQVEIKVFKPEEESSSNVASENQSTQAAIADQSTGPSE